VLAAAAAFWLALIAQMNTPTPIAMSSTGSHKTASEARRALTF